MGSRKRRRERDVAVSKKHKRRSRSRSRSPLSTPPPPSLSTSSKYERDDRGSRELERERDRDRRHHTHKKQKDHKHKNYSKDRSPRDRERTRTSEPDYHSDSSDVVEVPIAPPAPVISNKRKSPSPIPENGAGDCLSIQETNKLRAKLGLKPLEVDKKEDTKRSAPHDGKGTSVEKRKDEWGEFYHKPAENLAEKIQADKLREKFRQRKEKRALEGKLKTVKTLGESEDFDDINDWVEKSREKEKSKADAQRRAKMLEEMDAEFGVEELVKKDIRENSRKIYNDRHLKGMRVDHDVDEFAEGKSVILTLKDYDVLDEEASDTLVNVNMIDNERYRKNVENKKQNPNQYGYNVYDEQVDEFGRPIAKSILSKYDDEIGDTSNKEFFVIGQNVAEERQHQRQLMEIKAKLAGKRLESLGEPLIAPASDTYTEQEMATFKKPKRKIKKIRQKLRVDDLLPLGDVDTSSMMDFGRRGRHSDQLDTDDMGHVPTAESNIKNEEEDNELEQILSKARRLKQSEALITKTLDMKTANVKVEVKTEKTSDDESDNNMTLNATAEFCRTLGDIPTYGMAGNRDIDTNDMMDIQSDSEVEDERHEEEPSAGTWNSVDTDLEKAPTDKQLATAEVAILDEEPDVGTSVGAALKLALSKGYLEREESNRPSNTRMAHLQAKNYSIEDKAYGDDEKFNRRDRFQSGPIMDFKEKETYKPNVKLEYIDDNGHILNEKEAFRYLSHKFHGKGPGKNKIEKRLKKSEQDGLMKKMSSTDTPLGTLTMLQYKQKETHSPYIVLSGSKQTHAATSITKQK